MIKSLFSRIFQTRKDLSKINQGLIQELDIYKTTWPPGHFYSPLPSIPDIKARESSIFSTPPKTINNIELNEGEQLSLIRELHQYYCDIQFRDRKSENTRYYYQNTNFSYGDAIMLYSMIRHFRPKRIIEVGSGYSSCATLDTNESFFGNAISCTFIEPYTDLLNSLIREEDKSRINIIPKRLEDVDEEIFTSLEENDILFIDSTHVSKINSDVNYLFFRILPLLRKGVIIHIHDIFYPFEYPKEWIYEGRAWNELYLLRAFLQYNDAYSILMFNSYISQFHPDMMAQEMPLFMRDSGSSFWMMKNKNPDSK